jgi:hypothetical protein
MGSFNELLMHEGLPEVIGVPEGRTQLQRFPVALDYVARRAGVVCPARLFKHHRRNGALNSPDASSSCPGRCRSTNATALRVNAQTHRRLPFGT